MNILSELKNRDLISAEIVKTVEEKVVSGTGVEAALLEAGIAAETLRSVSAEYYNVPAYVPSEDVRIPEEVLNYIAEESARHYHIVPLEMVDDVLLVAINDPEDLQIKEVLNFVSTKHEVTYKFVFALQSDIEALFVAYASLRGEVGEALTSLETELDASIAEKQNEQSQSSVKAEHIEEDAPVTKIVATVLRYAVDGRASDIHIEPYEEQVRVRFRVDGELQTSLQLPQNVQSAVVARVKILSSMRLDERRKPQDGRFSATFDGRKIDFRVSVLPTSHGEKVVMRILDNSRGVSNLSETGISEAHMKTIQRIVKEPYGIILISGPTGSGKSTTLYSMLGEIDRLTKNVLSLEDPVEYNIEGVSQSQVRPEIGYTFAAGLRSALRQDPDIIMVGEIRDKETAQLAIQAALTGHLVLSTIHTNNSIGVIPRLIDMGVDPYLIAPTLKLAIAQRLARRLCPGTGKEVSVEGSTKVMFEKEFETLPDKYRGVIPESTTVIHPQPSPGCATGTKGRVAVMETLEISPAIEELILRGGSEEEIYNAARADGFVSMKEDAIIKALDHIIPIEEVSAFGTKVGKDNVLDDEYLPVDNKSVDIAADGV